MAYNIYTMLSFVIVDLANGYVKNVSTVKPFTMIGNGVSFTSIYKPKMTKQGWFLFHQKKQKLLEKTKIKILVVNLKSFALIKMKLS